MKKILTNIKMLIKLLNLKMKGANVFPIYVQGYVLIIEKIK